MFKNYFRSFIYAMGEVLILFIILSLIWSEAINIKHLYHMIGVGIPVHLFSFFTFELKLFSKHIWIRRTIVISFSLLVLFASGCIWDSIHLDFKSLIIYCITALLCIMVTVFAYYVADKIEQQNLKLINQKLSEKNTRNIE
ncbi:MAG: hypothetical protein E7629_09575 [Ruminococcaceae bacterium]|nr:hypothetical protein [Oscillospiraceae bacterium]